MSPERTSPGGQFRTDWRRKEVGRIRVTYGYTEKEHMKAVHLLDALYDNDQLDVLRALKARKVTVKELLAAKKAGRHKRDDVLVDMRLQQPLWTTLATMIVQRGGSPNHVKVRQSHLRKFARSPAAGALGIHATVAQLRDVDWPALRSHYGSAADWNHMRKMIGATLSELLEDVLHPFRREVMKQIAKEKEVAHDVDVTVDQFWALVGAAADVAQASIVTLAVTGMRLETEYLRCTAADKRPHVFGVYCPGSKNADAAGVIPVAESLWEWVDAGVPSPLKQKWLREHFHRAAVAVGLGQFVEVDATRRYEGLTLHDLRHLALQLALDGGAQINDVQNFARHADPAMTMRYLKRAGRRRAADAIGRSLAVDKSQTQEKKA